MLADEPTGNLDTDDDRRDRQAVQSSCTPQGQTIVDRDARGRRRRPLRRPHRASDATDADDERPCPTRDDPIHKAVGRGRRRRRASRTSSTGESAKTRRGPLTSAPRRASAESEEADARDLRRASFIPDGHPRDRADLWSNKVRATAHRRSASSSAVAGVAQPSISVINGIQASSCSPSSRPSARKMMYIVNGYRAPRAPTASRQLDGPCKLSARARSTRIARATAPSVETLVTPESPTTRNVITHRGQQVLETGVTTSRASGRSGTRSTDRGTIDGATHSTTIDLDEVRQVCIINDRSRSKSSTSTKNPVGQYLLHPSATGGSSSSAWSRPRRWDSDVRPGPAGQSGRSSIPFSQAQEAQPAARGSRTRSRWS